MLSQIQKNAEFIQYFMVIFGKDKKYIWQQDKAYWPNEKRHYTVQKCNANVTKRTIKNATVYSNKSKVYIDKIHQGFWVLLSKVLFCFLKKKKKIKLYGFSIPTEAQILFRSKNRQMFKLNQTMSETNPWSKEQPPFNFLK